MRKFAYVLCAFMVLFASCSKSEKYHEPTEKDSVNNVLVVYFMGASNLSGYLEGNITQMKNAVKQGALNGGRLLIFKDTYSGSTLTELVRHGDVCDVVQRVDYGNIDCTDAKVMRRILNDVRYYAPAKHYGFVLGSHGTAWIPDTLDVSTSDDIILGKYGYQALWNHKYLANPETRCVGYDEGNGMNLEELADGLSPIHFDFVLFDACYMASVETAWELRNSTDRIVASTPEVMAAGFPYAEIVPSLFSDWTNLIRVGELFVNSYKYSSQPYAAISVLRTSKLPELAAAVAKVYATADTIDGTRVADINYIQHYEGLSSHIFYDMDEYMERIATDSDALVGFRSALLDVVEYNDHTTRAYTAVGARGSYPLLHCSGLNSYIPQKKHKKFYDTYMKTSWADAASVK